jgi:hypothetical protein
MTQLNELKTELASLRVQKIAGGSASKLTKMWVVLFIVWVVMVLCQIWGMETGTRMDWNGLVWTGYETLEKDIYAYYGIDWIEWLEEDVQSRWNRKRTMAHHTTSPILDRQRDKLTKQQHCPKVHCPSPYRHQPKAEAEPPRLLQEVQV